MARDLTTRGEYAMGPCEAALNNRQRLFVHALFDQPPGKGAFVAAARQAGYGANSDAQVLSATANRLLNDEKVIVAIQEQVRKRIRSLGPQAVAGLQQLIASPGHRDHFKALSAILDRLDPIVTKHEVEVSKKPEDNTAQLLAVIDGYRKAGKSDDFIAQVLGSAETLYQLEQERARRAGNAAKPVVTIDQKPADGSEGLEDLLG